VAKVRELKQADGLGIWLCGGGGLAETLWPKPSGRRSTAWSSSPDHMRPQAFVTEEP
jgi:hypothetical protein